MAIEWSKKENNCHYEVRSAGATQRLYTNKVFHSQYNPNKKLQGGIWDLLSLPAFTQPVGRIQRVLVLGVGGGAVLKQLHKLISPRSIIGIELNSTHIYVAKTFFNLNEKSINLVEANAIDWLQQYQGEAFDLIIDDLFGHDGGEAERVIAVNKQWAATLLKHLNPSGILVVNFASNKEMNNSACVAYKKIVKNFNSILRLTLPQYENAIGLFSKNSVEAKKMLLNFQRSVGLSEKVIKRKMNCRIKKIK